MISKKSKIIAALSLSMMIGIGSNVFAATNSTSKETKKPNKMMEMFKNKKCEGFFSIEALGLSKEDIAAAKKSGKTIFDLAQENKGMTADQVKAALIKAETDKINKKVSDGKLTQEKATAMIAKITERINNWDGSIKYFNHDDKDKKGEGFFSIEALGLSKEDIAAAKKSGKTIFDLAQEKKGMTADQVKAALIKAETDKINKKVSDGKLTQEKATAMIAKITENINNWDGNLKPAKPEKKEHTKKNTKENSKTKVNSKTTLKAQSQKKAM